PASTNCPNRIKTVSAPAILGLESHHLTDGIQLTNFRVLVNRLTCRLQHIIKGLRGWLRLLRRRWHLCIMEVIYHDSDPGIIVVGVLSHHLLSAMFGLTMVGPNVLAR